MRRFTIVQLVAVVAGVGLAVSVHAGTKYQTNLVPDQDGTTPGFSAKGSSVKLDDKLHIKGKIKNVVDASGVRITTDDLNAGDEYSVEVDLVVPATAGSGTVMQSFDLKNGNGKFKADLSLEPVIAGAAAGDGVVITDVRVKDDLGNVIGGGGFLKK